MSQSKYKSTSDTTNFARVARLLLGPCTDVLRAVLLKEISPSDLEKKVRLFVTKQTKNTKTQITKEQAKLVNGRDYSRFDITLMYNLLRNICSIPPHKTQWGNDPCSGDRSVSAHIERIRLRRNEYGHISKFSIPDNDFNNIWQEMVDIIDDLERHIGTSTDYHDAVIYLKTCPMDPEQYREDIDQLRDKAIVPWNMRVLHEKTISKWIEDDQLFLPFHNYEAMLKQVKSQSYVTFVGVQGSGKSATVHHIALQLRKEGYEVLPIRDIRHLETYCDPHNRQVFVLDDALGVFGLDLTKLDVLNEYQDRLTDPEMPGTKILLTCREVVYRNKMSANSFLFKNENVVLLHSKENVLNDMDKRKLLEKYQLDANKFTSEDLASSSNMFPLLCKLFTERKYRVYGPKFFISPIPCILKVFDELKTRQRLHYASLVLLMAYQNKLSKNMLELENESKGNLNEKTCKFLKNCDVSRYTDSIAVSEALSELKGTYIRQCGTEFNFIHDSMFEITAYHFGIEFPELMLLYMSSEYIANYFKVFPYTDDKKSRRGAKNDQKSFYHEYNEKTGGKEEVIDLCILLKEPNCAKLGERLFRDAKNGELYTVFGNEALKHPTVLQAFIDMIEAMTYEEFYSMFLSELKDIFELSSLSQSKPEGHRFNFGDYYNIHSLLSDKKLIGRHVKNSVRTISWVIYYGHTQLFQHIIDRIMKENENVNDLFQTSYNKNYRRTSITEIEIEIDEDDCASGSLVNFSSKKSCMSCLHFIVHVFWDKSNTNVTNEGESENATDKNLVTTKDKDSQSDIDSYSEPLIAEQNRLLCIGCYSGDLEIVKTLLKYLKEDALMERREYFGRMYACRYPLEIACSLGHLEIAIELMKVGGNQTESMYKSMIGASTNGYVNVVEELIKNGANVNHQDCSETPLIAACEEGHLEVVQLLIKAGADIYRREAKQTPLKVACQKRYLDIVKLLIKTGSDAYLKDGHEISLPTACFEGSVSIVKDYIVAGADVNLKVGVISPLTAACFTGQFHVVKELISAGANVDLRDDDKTPLTTACREGHLGVANILLKSGADVNLRDEIQTPLTSACAGGHADIVKQLIVAGACVNQADGKETPLSLACELNFLSIARELITNDADVNLRASDKTPLTVSCYEGHVQIVQTLIESGADVNLKDKHKTPLTTACYRGHSIIAELLIKAGANVNLKDTDKTPLTVACTEGQVGIVRLLIKAKANVNLRDGVRLPLTATFYEGHLNVVKELIKGGADVNLEDGDKTILTAACYSKHSIIVEELIRSGANVNLKDKEKTPLTTACNMGRLNIVRILIELGADVNLRDLKKTPLTTACETSHIDIIKELIESGAEVNLSDGEETPLTTACDRQNLIAVKELIISGADVNLKDKTRTPLTTACYRGDLSIVKELIKADADVNLNDDDRTPLIAACSKGYLKVIQELIKAKADVNQWNANETPLTVACDSGDIRIVGELIIAGADLNPKNTYKTPLTSACQQNNLRLVEELIKSGAYANLKDGYETPLINVCCKGYLNIVQVLTKAGADVNLSDKGKTPLTAACQHGHLNVVEELIKEGADVNLSDGSRVPLMVACEKGNLDIVKELIKAGATVNLEDGDKTILTAACYTKQLSIVEELIRSGADVNLKDKEKTPLTIACHFGHLRIVKELIRNGADVNQIDANNTPLTVACARKNISVLEELIKGKADVNLKDKYMSPLTTACYHGSVSVVKILIRENASVNLGDKDKTPLIAACTEGHLDIVKELIETGADVNLGDGDRMPLMFACMKGHRNIVQELINAGANVNSEVVVKRRNCGHLSAMKGFKKSPADISNIEKTYL